MKHEHKEVFKVNVVWVLHWEHLFSTLYLCQVLVPVVFVCFEVWIHLYRSISTRKYLLWNSEYTSGTSCTSLLKSKSYIHYETNHILTQTFSNGMESIRIRPFQARTPTKWSVRQESQRGLVCGLKMTFTRLNHESYK